MDVVCGSAVREWVVRVGNGSRVSEWGLQSERQILY